MTKVKNFNNTYCKATEKNLATLLARGYKFNKEQKYSNWIQISNHKTYKHTDIFAIKENTILWLDNFNISERKEIILIDGDFYFEESLNGSDMFLCPDCNKYSIFKGHKKICTSKKEEKTIANRFGFKEPEFEYDLYFQDDEGFITGWIKNTTDDKKYICSWTKEGKVWNLHNSKEPDGGSLINGYNLEPLKTPWCKNKDNIGKIIYSETFKNFYMIKEIQSDQLICLNLSNLIENSLDSKKCSIPTEEQLKKLIPKE